MDVLVYIGVLVSIACVAIGGVWILRKYKVTKDELGFIGLVVELIDYITGKFEFKYKNSVSKIMEYVLEAVIFVGKFDDIDDKDIERKKTLVFEKAKEICATEGIDVDGELETIISEAIDFLIKSRAIKLV